MFVLIFARTLSQSRRLYATTTWRLEGWLSLARTVPLDQIQEQLKHNPVDVAVNIHSFSECTLPAINWWCALLSCSGVKHLMIVPNAAPTEGLRLLAYEFHDFQPVIEKFYRLIAKEPKYDDPLVQKYAINPTYYYLFELK